MHFLLKVLRNIALTLIALVVTLLLSLLIFTFTLSHTLLDKEVVTSWIDRQETYELVEKLATNSITENVAEENQQQVTEFKDLIQKYFDKEFFGRATNTLVDATYAWLEGDDSVNFEISIFDNVGEAKEFMVQGTLSRIESLPECENQAQLQQAAQSPFEAECKAPNITQSQVKQRLDEASDEQLQELHESATLTDESLGFTQPDQNLQNIREAFQLLQVAPYIIGACILALLGLALLIIQDWSKWLRFSGWKFVGASVGIVTLFLVGYFAFDVTSSFRQQMADQLPIDPSEITVFIGPIITDFIVAFMSISGFIFTLGLLLLGVGWFLRRRHAGRPKSPEDMSPSFAAKK